MLSKLVHQPLLLAIVTVVRVGWPPHVNVIVLALAAPL
jgi:hypothetical protein